MPFDGFKFTIVNKEVASLLLNQPDLKFLKVIDGETGEDTNRFERLVQNRIAYTPLPNGEVQLSGNLYEYYKQTRHLASFSFSECQAALDTLCTSHNLNAADIRVDKLEIGFNLTAQRCPKDILRDIVTYRYKTKEVNTYRGKGLGASFDLQDYKILFYDKGKKHKLDRHLLRAELIAKQGLLRRNGIYTAEDLHDREKVLALCQHLRKCIEDTVFTDRQMDTHRLSPKELQLFQGFRTDADWIDLNIVSSENSRKIKKKYQQLIDRCGTNNTKKWLLESIDQALVEHELVKNGKDYRFSAVDKRWENCSFIQLAIKPNELAAFTSIQQEKCLPKSLKRNKTGFLKECSVQPS